MLVWFYLLLLPSVTEGCTLAGNTEVKPVTSYTGGSVTLPCSCTNLQSKPETVTWMKYTNQWVKISPESKQYKDRVQLVNDLSPGNLSLLISHLTEEDNGDYSCRVNGGELRYVRLAIKGCILTQQTERVTRTEGQSVLLPCFCYELQAKPQTFTWIFYIGSNNRQIFPKDETNRYRGRVQFFNDRSPGNLSLLISHLSLQDVGWYRCETSNHQSRDIHLTVKGAPNTPSTSTPKIIKTTSKAGLTNNKRILGANEETSGNETPPVIIISSSVAGVLLLLLILGALMYWKYRGRRQGQTENGDRQTGQRTQQNTQDFSKPLNLTVTSETTEAVHKQNDPDVLYAAINPQSKLNKAEEKDDVTYSTVVHGNTVRAAHTPVTSGDTTVYASIKTN